jgi:predicted anti-sigma-YlaC factor YlaD
MNNKTVSCKKMYTHICDNLDQDIDSPKCRAIKRHLDDCPNCLVYLDSLKKTIILYREYPNPKMPKSIRRQIFSKLKITPEK